MQRTGEESQRKGVWQIRGQPGSIRSARGREAKARIADSGAIAEAGSGPRRQYPETHNNDPHSPQKMLPDGLSEPIGPSRAADR
jgi:hypothetical protein